MSGRQALDRAAQRFANIDIRLAGNWDPLPQAIIDSATEIADVCRLFGTADVTSCKTIGQLADRIGTRFEGRAYAKFSLIL